MEKLEVVIGLPTGLTPDDHTWLAQRVAEFTTTLEKKLAIRQGRSAP